MLGLTHTPLPQLCRAFPIDYISLNDGKGAECKTLAFFMHDKIHQGRLSNKGDASSLQCIVNGSVSQSFNVVLLKITFQTPIFWLPGEARCTQKPLWVQLTLQKIQVTFREKNVPPWHFCVKFPPITAYVQPGGRALRQAMLKNCSVLCLQRAMLAAIIVTASSVTTLEKQLKFY